MREAKAMGRIYVAIIVASVFLALVGLEVIRSIGDYSKQPAQVSSGNGASFKDGQIILPLPQQGVPPMEEPWPKSN